MKPEVLFVGRNGRPVLYLPLVPTQREKPSIDPDSIAHLFKPGEVVRGRDQFGIDIASADIARVRLRDVVKRDRAAVPCGRWVRRHYGIYHAAIVAGYASAAWDAYRRGDLGLFRLYRELLRPRYRYEVRR